MDIPISAEVQCSDDHRGRSTYVIINPATQQVTHLVVRDDAFPYLERLVPIDKVVKSTEHLIRLQCSHDQLVEMESFIRNEYVPGKRTLLGYEADTYLMWPYQIPEAPTMFVEHMRTPPGELAVRRGAHVNATDGRVGQVDEFLVDPQDGHITHLVMRTGHPWGRKDITLPVSEIDHIKDNTVYIRLDKAGVEALPAVPVRQIDDTQVRSVAP